MAMSENAETAILSGGCAWIMQQLLRHPDGVISTRVGWTGGEGADPTEESPGGHAEAVEVVFDPGRISYRGLLEYFFQVHRPDLGEQLVGSIYRSEIFCTSDEQRRVAEQTIRDVDASGHWLGKTVTEISDADRFRFWEFEAKDQDYFLRYPEYPDGSEPPFPRRDVPTSTPGPT
jgi:peptide-methionine (S)-S-oxide reductase